MCVSNPSLLPLSPSLPLSPPLSPSLSLSLRLQGVGEVLVSGRHVFMGYMGNTVATSEVLTSDGWLRSWDLGYLSEVRVRLHLSAMPVAPSLDYMWCSQTPALFSWSFFLLPVASSLNYFEYIRIRCTTFCDSKTKSKWINEASPDYFAVITKLLLQKHANRATAFSSLYLW